ncbi:hypothetical protein E4U28_002807 [Claviceps purpurea]|nr:hypothetical protein E4U28_002807 [Claviceps purpurea]
MLHDINNPRPPPNDAYPVMAKPQASSKLHFHPSPSVPISASLRALRHLAFGLVSQESQVSRVSQSAASPAPLRPSRPPHAPRGLSPLPSPLFMASQALSIRPAETHTPAGLFTGSTTTPRPRQHLNHAIHMIPTLSQTTPPSACRPKKHRTSSHQEEERTPPRGTSKKDQQEGPPGGPPSTRLPPSAAASYHQLPPAQAAKAAPLARLEC